MRCLNDAECAPGEICTEAGICQSDRDDLVLAGDPDSDGDALSDVTDNCPLVPNADQADADLDGVGSDCDLKFAPEPSATAGFVAGAILLAALKRRSGRGKCAARRSSGVRGSP